MRERHESAADLLVDAGAPVDGKYRLERLIRRSPTATIHSATHRNGSTAWLKIPVSPSHGALLTLEASIANTIGSPLLVFDDGKMPDGLPYLILDPPDGEVLASLRARGKAGARLALMRVMTSGDAVARAVASVHALGYVTAGVDDDNLLVLANSDVALLDLHAVTAATPEGIAADVKSVITVLRSLVDDVADKSQVAPVRAALDAMLAKTHPDVAALQLAWRAASPEPIVAPVRGRSQSFPDLASGPKLPAHDTPLGMSVEKAPPIEMEGSMIGYLRSTRGESIRPAVPRERVEMYDPLSKEHDMPRLVHATSKKRDTKPPPAPRAIMGYVVAGAAAAMLAGALGVGVWSMSSDPQKAAPAQAALTAPTPITPAPPAVVAAAAATTAAESEPAPAPADDLELNTALSTENAPSDRDVFVDGVSVGRTPLDKLTVPCGKHTLQMVAGGSKESVDLPCGGARVVRYDAKGHWMLK